MIFSALQKKKLRCIEGPLNPDHAVYQEYLDYIIDQLKAFARSWRNACSAARACTISAPSSALSRMTRSISRWLTEPG